MSVGVMEDYKLRDLRASHTLGWSWNWSSCCRLVVKRKMSSVTPNISSVWTVLFALSLKVVYSCRIEAAAQTEPSPFEAAAQTEPSPFPCKRANKNCCLL